MTTIAPERSEIDIKPGIRGFEDLAKAVDLNLEEVDRAFQANVRPLRAVAALAPLPGRAMR